MPRTRSSSFNADANANRPLEVRTFLNPDELLENARSNIGKPSAVLKRICDLQAVRTIQYRNANKPVRLRRGRPFHAEATVAQATGTPASQPCGRCMKRNGNFEGCIVLPGYFKGSCANCHFGHRDSQCSLWEGQPGPKRTAKGAAKRRRSQVASEQDPLRSPDQLLMDNTGPTTRSKGRRCLNSLSDHYPQISPGFDGVMSMNLQTQRTAGEGNIFDPEEGIQVSETLDMGVSPSLPPSGIPHVRERVIDPKLLVSPSPIPEGFSPAPMMSHNSLDEAAQDHGLQSSAVDNNNLIYNRAMSETPALVAINDEFAQFSSSGIAVTQPASSQDDQENFNDMMNLFFYTQGSHLDRFQNPENE